MRLDFVSRAVHDVHAAAVGLPSRDTRWEMLVGVGDAPVVLFLELVLDGVGRGIAALPECFNELVAFFVVGELLESRALFVGDDPAHVLVEPLLVGARNFLLEPLLVGLALFVARAAASADQPGRPDLSQA